LRVSNPTANAGGFWAQARGPGLPAYVEGKLETTLTEKFKTEVRMLPQSGPLEGQAVGPQGSAGSPRNGPAPNAARQQWRGETGRWPALPAP